MKKLVMLFVVISLFGCGVQKSQMVRIEAKVETESVVSSGDAADDPAIWIHSTDHEQSLILGSNKKLGIYSYDLHGNVKQFLPLGRVNNIDIRQSVPVNGEVIDIVSGTNRSTNRVEVLQIDDGIMKPLNLDIPSSKLSEVYGFCMGFINNQHLVFLAVGLDEDAELYELKNNKKESYLEITRTLPIETKSEGCVIDDDSGEIFVGEEEVGIWRFNYFDENIKDKVISIESKNLKADIEGLALFNANGKKYLIASSQGSNTYPVFDRKDYSFVKTFQVVAGKEIDGTTETDGIEFSTELKSKEFPLGVFIVQDDKNTNPRGNQNFKLISAEEIINEL